MRVALLSNSVMVFVVVVVASSGELRSQVIERANLAEDGSEDPGSAFTASPAARGISADGRFVLFITPGNLSPTLDQNSTSGHDVYVRDRQLGKTILISSAAAVPQVLPHASMSTDGSVVAFQDKIGPAAPGSFGLFLRSVSGGSQRRVDIGPAGEESSRGGYFPRLSADGSVLFFNSVFFVEGLGSQTGIWRRDLAAGSTVAFEVRSGIFESAGPRDCAISDDAGVVAFAFGPGIHLKGAPGDEAELVVPGVLSTPALSGDSRFLAFFDTRGQIRDRGLYLVDLAGDRQPTLIHAMTLSQLPGVFTPTLSRSGDVLAFQTRANIDPSDSGRFVDAYLYNRERDAFFLLSSSAAGELGNNDAGEVYVSSDGQTAALTSMADNLVPNDTNDTSDVFVAVPGLLRVTVAGPENVLVGQAGRFTAVVANESAFTIEDVSLTIERQEVAIAIFNDPPCAVEDGRRLVCELGDLEAGQGVAVDFSLLSLGIETVSYSASAAGTHDGRVLRSGQVEFPVIFDRCALTIVGSELGEFGGTVDLLLLFSGRGDGEVEFNATVEEPGGILARERLGDEQFSLRVTAIERPGDVTVTATAARDGCTATAVHTITFLRPVLNRVPSRRAETPQEPVNDDGDADAIVKTPPCSVLLHNGENRHDRTDLVIPGRGDVHFVMSRRYRSQIRFDGPLGNNWDFNYNELLAEEADGDVVRVNGRSHVDVWRRNADGSYTAPRGHFSTLRKKGDGTFVLREPTGFKRFYRSDGRLQAHEDRNGNRMAFDYDAEDHLDFVTDPYGRRIDFVFEDGRLSRIRDFFGREVVYTYDENRDLVAVRTPLVTNTSTENDFPQGRVERYVYSAGFADEDLNHNLLQIIHPEEAATGGPPAMTWTYGTDPLDLLTFDRVLTQQEGGTNSSGVAAGGTSSFVYEEVNLGMPSGDSSVARFKTTVTDRKGNVSECFFNELSQHILTRELTRGLRDGEPEAFETRYEYDEDDQLVRLVMPQGNEIRYAYSRSGPRGAQRNVIEIRRVPDAERGGGEDLVTTMTYEPLFNRLASITDPRGNAQGFAPPLGVASAERYTWRFVYDYQEGSGEIPDAREFQIDLSNADRGLGDLNQDGRTDQIAGNCIRVVAPPVELLPDSREAERLTSQVQEVLTDIQWNDHGQKIATIDPEGNVTVYSYYRADDPDGDGVTVPDPAGSDDSGYVQSVTVDASESARRMADAAPTALETAFRYDPVGNITAMRNPRGVVTELEVNQLDEPVQIIQGAEVAEAEVSGELLTGEAPFRYRVRFFYDHNGRVVRMEMENRDSNTPGVGEFVERSFAYDILDNPVEHAVEVAEDTVLVWSRRYDANELLSLVVEPRGNEYALEYDERNLPFLITRGRGSAEQSTSRLDYDFNRNLLGLHDGEDNDGDGVPELWRITYDGFDRALEFVDPLGNRTESHYDVRSNVVRRRFFGHPANGPAVVDGPETGPTEVLLVDVYFSHDELDRVFQVDDSLFLSEGFEPVRPIALHDANSDGFVTTRVEYDRSSRVTSQIEDDGQILVTLYDGADRPVEYRDAAGNRVEIEYDQNSNPVRRREFERATDSVVGDEVFTTLFVYDQLDRLVRVTDNIGRTTRFSYDSRDNMTARSDPEGTLVPDPLGLFPGDINDPGNTVSFVYDGLDRLIRKAYDLRQGGRGGNPLDLTNPENPDGQVSIEFGYDPNSRISEIADDNGNRTTVSYDALNRKVVQRNADGSEFRYRYDRDDNPIQWTDPNGSVIDNVYDALNRLVERRIERADGVQGTTRETFGYDGLGRLTTRTDDNGRESPFETEFVYDSLSRLLEERQKIPEAGASGPAFIRGDCNSDGSTSSVTDVIFLLGFVFLGTEAPTCRESCDVNGNGSLDGVTDVVYLLSFNFLGTEPPPPPFPDCGASDLVLGCESHRHCAAEGGAGPPDGSENAIVSSVFSGDGKRLSCTYPGGRTISHVFDSIDRITRTSDEQGLITESSWIGPGYRELIRTGANGTSLSFLDDRGEQDTGYDAIKRMVRLRCFLPDGTTAFLDRDYGYNRANFRNFTRRNDDVGLIDRFYYDSSYRIVRTELDMEGSPAAVRREAQGIDYVLDGVGNRRRVVFEGVSGEDLEERLDVNEMNEYTAVGGKSRLYDDNGNLTDDGVRLFAYDYKNRLVRVADKATGTVIAEYFYHGDNRRARKDVFDSRGKDETGVRTLFFYDGWRVCEERQGDGAGDDSETTYVWSPVYIDELVQIQRSAGHPLGSGTFFAHQNLAADVVALTDSTGNIVDKRFYDDYGNSFDAEKTPTLTGVLGTPYGFQGRRLDSETGFYYLRNRYYHPGLGRFLQRDPISDPANVANQYTYVGNSPASRSDPSGLLSFEWSEDYPFFSLKTGGPITWLLDSLILDASPQRRKKTVEDTSKPPRPESFVPGKGGMSEDGLFAPMKLDTHEEVFAACRMNAMVDLVLYLLEIRGGTAHAINGLAGFPRVPPQRMGRSRVRGATSSGSGAFGDPASPRPRRSTTRSRVVGSEAPTEIDLPAVVDPDAPAPPAVVTPMGSWKGSQHVVISAHGVREPGKWVLGHDNVMVRMPPMDKGVDGPTTGRFIDSAGAPRAGQKLPLRFLGADAELPHLYVTPLEANAAIGIPPPGTIQLRVPRRVHIKTIVDHYAVRFSDRFVIVDLSTCTVTPGRAYSTW